MDDTELVAVGADQEHDGCGRYYGHHTNLVIGSDGKLLAEFMSGDHVEVSKYVTADTVVDAVRESCLYRRNFEHGLGRCDVHIYPVSESPNGELVKIVGKLREAAIDPKVYVEAI